MVGRNLLLLMLAVCCSIHCLNVEAKTAISRVENGKWVKVSTPNFELITDLKKKKWIRLATDLEKFRKMYQRVFATDLSTKETPLKIIAPKKSDIYDMFVRGNRQLVDSNGFFIANNHGNYATIETKRATQTTRLCRSTKSKQQVVDQNSLSRLFHEYTHYLIANQNKHNLPFWYSEGFADYLSTARVLNDGLVIYGEDIEHHLYLINCDSWVSMEKILKTTRDVELEVKEKYRVYSQGWLMVHYFLADSERAKQLDEFLSLLSAGLSVDAAIAKALKRSYHQLDSELRGYAKKGRFYYRKIDTKYEDEELEIIAKPLRPAETLFEIGEFILNGLTQPSQAEGFFKRSREIDPQNGPANAGLAKIYLDTDPQLAQTFIKQALEQKPNSPWVQMVAGDLSTATLEESESEAYQNQFRNQAMRHYDRALELNPHAVAALSSKASLYFKQAKFERALQLFQQAYKYAPTSGQARFDLIVANYAVGRFEEGDKIAEIVRRNHHAPKQEIESFNSWAVQQKTNAKAYFDQNAVINPN